MSGKHGSKVATKRLQNGSMSSLEEKLEDTCRQNEDTLKASIKLYLPKSDKTP